MNIWILFVDTTWWGRAFQSVAVRDKNEAEKVAVCECGFKPWNR